MHDFMRIIGKALSKNFSQRNRGELIRLPGIIVKFRAKRFFYDFLRFLYDTIIIIIYAMIII